MLLGLGTCVLLLPTPLAGVAALALYGCLFHLLNHGVFKSLLFLNAGTLLTTTGTQDLNRLGGLLRPMPWTALCALVGVISIVGAPLTSGFASKWGLYSAAIHGGSQSWLLPVCALLAIFTSGLTLAVFIRFYGAAFLSRTSALVKEKLAVSSSLEPGPLQLAPKLWLAAWCIVLGLMPYLGFRAIELGLHQSRQGLGIILADTTPLGGSLTGGMMAGDAQAVWTPLALAGTLALMLLLARGLGKLGQAARRQAAPISFNRWSAGCVRRKIVPLPTLLQRPKTPDWHGFTRHSSPVETALRRRPSARQCGRVRPLVCVRDARSAPGRLPIHLS
jgi:formate hydrogenlyase subunit 3/multisubunit Na+/H+ antiporter MnhD subunit